MAQEEKLEEAKRLYETANADQKYVLESLFPELKESEDERIRKWLIDYLNNKILNSTIIAEKENLKKAIAWLEKQGERDVITFNNAHIIDHALNDYCCKQYDALYKENGGVMSFARLQHLAMDIYAWCKKLGEQKPTNKVEPKFKIGDTIYYNSFGEVKSMVVANICDNGDGNPMYEDSEGNAVFEKDVIEHNTAEWSKEDIKILGKILFCLKSMVFPSTEEIEEMRHWLKSLCNKISPQPKQEWSEEDEQYLLVCKNALAKYQVSDKWDAHIISHWLENKLKSLRPQNTWKPSDEQIEILDMVLSNESMDDNVARILRDIREQLKKLREDSHEKK